jgi:uncharacterized protein (DUF433 family)
MNGSVTADQAIKGTTAMALDVMVDPLPLRTDDDGVVRVGETRVTLDTVVGAFVEGSAAEEIVLRYPSLALADVYAVLGYYLRHRADVEVYLQQRSAHAKVVREQNERRTDPIGIRERLVARQSSTSR